jgi:hypothetical protein
MEDEAKSNRSSCTGGSGSGGSVPCRSKPEISRRSKGLLLLTVICAVGAWCITRGACPRVERSGFLLAPAPGGQGSTCVQTTGARRRAGVRVGAAVARA